MNQILPEHKKQVQGRFSKHLNIAQAPINSSQAAKQDPRARIEQRTPNQIQRLKIDQSVGPALLQSN